MAMRASTLPARILLGLTVAGLLGCPKSDEAKGQATTPTPTAAASAPATAASAPAPSGKPGAGLARLQGEWRLQLSDAERRRNEVMRAALSPAEDSVKGMQLTGDELMMVAQVKAMVSRNPDDPRVAQMRALIEQMGEMRMTVTGQKWDMRLLDQRELSDFDIVSDEGGKLNVPAKNMSGGLDHIVFEFESDDQVSMAKTGEPDKMVFRRVKAGE